MNKTSTSMHVKRIMKNSEANSTTLMTWLRGKKDRSLDTTPPKPRVDYFLSQNTLLLDGTKTLNEEKEHDYCLGRGQISCFLHLEKVIPYPLPLLFQDSCVSFRTCWTSHEHFRTFRSSIRIYSSPPPKKKKKLREYSARILYLRQLPEDACEVSRCVRHGGEQRLKEPIVSLFPRKQPKFPIE